MGDGDDPQPEPDNGGSDDAAGTPGDVLLPPKADAIEKGLKPSDDNTVEVRDSD